MPKTKINWRAVPDCAFLAETNTALAARLHCTTQNVAHQRRLRNLAAHPRGGDRPGTLPEKPPMRLSRSAAAHLRQLARAAGLSPSAYLLRLPSFGSFVETVSSPVSLRSAVLCPPSSDPPSAPPPPAQNHNPPLQKKALSRASASVSDA